MDRILSDPRVVFNECMCCFAIHSSIVSDKATCCDDPMDGGGASMRALFKINSAGVTPVEIFSTVFIIRCTMGVARTTTCHDHVHQTVAR